MSTYEFMRGTSELNGLFDMRKVAETVESVVPLSYEMFAKIAQMKEKEIITTFQAIDTDHDNIIHREQFKQSLKGVREPLLSETDIDAFKLLKKDSNEQISLSEFHDTAVFSREIRIKLIFDSWRQTIMEHASDLASVAHVSTTQKPSSAVLLASGGIAGAVSRTCTAPFDRLKLIMQAAHPLPNTARIGFFSGLSKIYAEGGFVAFFRGNGTNVIKIVPETATRFFVYEKSRALLDQQMIFGFDSVANRFAAGALAGLFSQAIVYPLEITKTRLALAPPGTYLGISDCISQIVRADGFRALYRGLTPSLVGIVPYAGVDLTVYSMLRDWYANNFAKEPPIVALLACGAFSSTCGQVVSYPLQLVRTRLQAQGMPGIPVIYDGAIDCFRKTIARDGFFGLYRGITPNFMKAIPAISISYAVYETAKRALSS